MVAKSHRNWSTISLGSLVIAGAAIALAALFQSPHLAFADDLSENAASAMQADAYAPVAAPAPPATSATPVPAPVIPAEGVAGAGTAAGATPAVPPASSIAIGGYYFGSWHKSGSRWWFSYPCGCFAKGWREIGDAWYLFDAQGWMKTGWQKVGKQWHYLESSGAMKTGWHKSGGSWYYLTPSGAMATNAWIDGYYVNASGAWMPNKTK